MMGTCIVTGGAGERIGAGISWVLAKRGHRVWIADRDHAAASRVADDITEAGGIAAPLPLDVSDADAVGTAIAHVTDTDGRLDGLVNSAGVGLVKLAADVTPADLDQLLDIDVRGVWNCSAAAIPHMIEAGSGSIVTIGSIHAHGAMRGFSVYAAAKAAVTALSRGIAADYGAHNIRSNVIHPGLVVGNVAGRFDQAGNSRDDWIADFRRKRQMLPHGVDGHDIGSAVAFLLSHESRSVTGSELCVDAGSGALLFDHDD